MTNAIHRTPCLETAEVKMLLNGPESFTPDGNFIVGEAPGLRNYFVCAGFNSAGIANSGGAGRLIAEWIVGGEAPRDLWDVDVRRFGSFTANRKALAERTAETLGLHYAMRWPRQELQTARPLRTSPLYDLLDAKGAEWGSKNGWERANYFAPPARQRPDHTLAHAGLAAVGARRAARHARAASRCTTRRRSPSCWCRGAMRWRCCSACAPTRSTCRWARWSTPRCSMSAAASRAT